MHARAVAATTTALLGAAVLLFCPSPPPTPRPGDDRPLVVAHRGASAYAPENTLAAVDKAAELGFRWVENDVQRTKDGELVVIHDDNLARTTNVEEVFPDRAPWKVAGLHRGGDRAPGRGQLVQPPVRGRARADTEAVHEPGDAQPPEAPPGDQEARALSGHRAGHPQGAEQRGLARPGARHGAGWSSRASARTACGQCTSCDPGSRQASSARPLSPDLPEYATFADQINAPYTTISKDYVSSIHALEGPHGKPLEILTWTVDNALAARRVARYGVDGIITNKPDVVRDATKGS